MRQKRLGPLGVVLPSEAGLPPELLDFPEQTSLDTFPLTVANGVATPAQLDEPVHHVGKGRFAFSSDSLTVTSSKGFDYAARGAIRP